MPLTPEQISFLERHLGLDLSQLNQAGDLAGQKEPPKPAKDLAKERGRVMEILRALAPPDTASAGERSALQRLQAQALGSMDDPLTESGIRGAVAVVGQIRDLLEQIPLRVAADAKRSEARRLTLDTLTQMEKDRSPDLLAEDIQALDRDALKIRQGLASDPPAPGDLTQAEEALIALKDLASQAGERATADRKRRVTRAADLRKTSHVVPDVLPAEAEELAKLYKALDLALPDPPSDLDLTAAAKIAASLDQRREDLALMVEDRRKRVAHIAQVLTGLTWGAGGLIPALGAPVDRVQALRSDTALLVQRLTPLAQLATAGALDETAVNEADIAAKVLLNRMTELNDEVTEALQNLTEAIQAATDAVTKAKGFKLVAAQIEAFQTRITALKAPALEDTSKVAPALIELAKIAKEATAFARSLGALAKRIALQTEAPKDALPSELTALAQARKSALDALEKATP